MGSAQIGRSDFTIVEPDSQDSQPTLSGVNRPNPVNSGVDVLYKTISVRKLSDILSNDDTTSNRFSVLCKVVRLQKNSIGGESEIRLFVVDCMHRKPHPIVINSDNQSWGNINPGEVVLLKDLLSVSTTRQVMCDDFSLCTRINSLEFLSEENISRIFSLATFSASDISELFSIDV